MLTKYTFKIYVCSYLLRLAVKFGQNKSSVQNVRKIYYSILLVIDAYKIKRYKSFVFFNRNHYRNEHPGDSCPCWKSPVYEKSTAPVGQESTYQELNIIENQYQTINPN